MDTPTKITRVLHRPDGSDVRIVAQTCYGRGLRRSIDFYVHRRESPSHDWKLLNDRPHPDWRSMSVDEYIKRGRAEMLQAVTWGEIFKVTSELAATAP